MSFGHGKLDVYRLAIEYVGWSYRLCEGLSGHKNARDQLIRASQAIPLNIAEGNGKATEGDRRRYFEIARGSALECGALDRAFSDMQKQVLDRIAALLSQRGRRGYAVREGGESYRELVDTDSDTDTDSDEDVEGESSIREIKPWQT